MEEKEGKEGKVHHAGPTVTDEHGGVEHFDRVVFACPATAVANALKECSWVEKYVKHEC